jgi:hypothetical protein
MTARPVPVRRTSLREDSRPGYSRSEWAALDESGALSIEGQSLSSSADFYEYEWAFRVVAEQVPRLVAALGGTAGDDVLALLVEHCRVHHPPDFPGLMDGAAIEYEFWSRVGD